MSFCTRLLFKPCTFLVQPCWALDKGQSLAFNPGHYPLKSPQWNQGLSNALCFFCLCYKKVGRSRLREREREKKHAGNNQSTAWMGRPETTRNFHDKKESVGVAGLFFWVGEEKNGTHFCSLPPLPPPPVSIHKTSALASALSTLFNLGMAVTWSPEMRRPIEWALGKENAGRLAFVWVRVLQSSSIFVSL